MISPLLASWERWWCILDGSNAHSRKRGNACRLPLYIGVRSSRLQWFDHSTYTANKHKVQSRIKPTSIGWHVRYTTSEIQCLWFSSHRRQIDLKQRQEIIRNARQLCQWRLCLCCLRFSFRLRKREWHLQRHECRSQTPASSSIAAMRVSPSMSPQSMDGYHSHVLWEKGVKWLSTSTAITTVYIKSNLSSLHGRLLHRYRQRQAEGKGGRLTGRRRMWLLGFRKAHS